MFTGQGPVWDRVAFWIKSSWFLFARCVFQSLGQFLLKAEPAYCRETDQHDLTYNTGDVREKKSVNWFIISQGHFKFIMHVIVLGMTNRHCMQLAEDDTTGWQEQIICTHAAEVQINKWSESLNITEFQLNLTYSLNSLKTCCEGHIKLLLIDHRQLNTD